MPKGKDDSNDNGHKEDGEFSDELTFRGTSQGVTRKRHCTSHKVIFVDNLPSTFEKQDFIDMFQEFGEILDIKFLKHKTGPETGFGFVEFAEEKNGRKAIRDWNWKMLENRIVRVSRAKPSTNKLSGTNLYVENVPVDWNDQMLYDYFSRICSISEARILMDQKKKISRGVGFVHCASNIEAKKAINWFNDDRLEENSLNLNVKFAKIPRADRNSSQRSQKADCQPQQKGTNNQSSKDVGESGLLSPVKDCVPQLQESNNNGKLGAKSSQKRNWYRYNEQTLLSHGKGIRLPSVKNPRSLSKSKRRKKLRRRQFQKRQLKKAMWRQIQNSENSNISGNFSEHLNTKSYQRELLSSSGSSKSEKAIRNLKFPVPNRGQNKRVQKCIRIQMPNTNMSKAQPPTQLFMNQQYKTAQVGGNIMGNYIFDSTQNNPLSAQGTYPVMCSTQTMQPYEYASSVGTPASSIMSSPVGPTSIRHTTPCTNVQSQNSNVQANTMFWTGLPVPYSQWQPLANPRNPSTNNKYVKTKVLPGNQMQQVGGKKDFSRLENGSIGGGASRAEFGGHQMNVNPQVGVSPSYYWPESQFVRQVVTPSGISLQPQQQHWSTDSISSVDSFSTTNEDWSMYYNTMNHFVPGGGMQYTNVHAQNPIIQNNSVHGSYSTFDPSCQIQYSMSNLSVCGVDTRSDTTSIQSSDISVQPFQTNNVFQATKTAAPAQKVWANHTKMENESNGGDKSDLRVKQQGVTPPLYMTQVEKSVAKKQQKYQNWSKASTRNTKVSSVKNVKQSRKKKSVSPDKKVITVGNLPVKVKVISNDNRSETIGFNHWRSANKNPFNCFAQKSKAKKNPFNGFGHKSKATKNPISGFGLERNTAKKPVTRGSEKRKVIKSPFMGLNRKPKMQKSRTSFTKMIPKNNCIQTK